MIPGFNGTAAMPEGSSCESDCVSPSIAHLLAQYGATSASVERPQPELKLTITPFLRFTIDGAKCRITFAVPFTFTSMTSENSRPLISHRRAFLLMIPALFSSKSGGACVVRQTLAHDFTASSCATSTE